MTRRQSCPASRGDPRRRDQPRRIAALLQGVPATAAGIAADVKAKIDIVELIGESVPLKKAGTTFKGLCPFHGEKTPSFVVTPARETWKCFGCGLGGDVFSFVMQREGVDFPEALRRLAARVGIELDERTTREDARRKRLREVMEAAVAWYHAVLTASKLAQPALDYLRRRGFTDTTIATYQLGFAPDAWDGLTRALITKRNVTEEELTTTGLAIRSERRRASGPGVYDRFRGRVIFPIRDASGAASGLGGRILEPADGGPTDVNADGSRRERGPKYLNSPATPLFDKSRTLYLIDRAKGPMRKAGQAVIVEGYTDALMAHQAGFENVVGGLGTALTAGQVELVTRYAPAIALAYDVDPAGQGAGTFGATELSALIGEIERSPHRGRLTEVGVVRLPEGMDPDEVIRDDPAAWRTATEGPQPIMEYLIDHYASRHDPRTIQGRERLVAAVMPTLRSIGDPIRRDGYLQLLARRSGVEERVLLEKLHQREMGPRGERPEGAHAGGRINLDALLASPDALDPRSVARTLEPAEATLLGLALLRPDLQAAVREQLADDDLITTPARELWRAIVADRDGDTDGAFRRDRFLEALDPTLGALARTIYARPEPEPGDPGLAIEQCLLTLRRRRLDEIIDFKRAELSEAEAGGDQAARERLGAELIDLNVKRRELDRARDRTTLLNTQRRADRTPAAAPGGTR